MKNSIRLLLLAILPLVAIASETKNGTLSVLLFSDGNPLQSNEVKIDGSNTYKTDADGAVKIELRAGTHQLEIFGRSASGVNLGYFKKPVTVKEGRDTEVIATLSKDDADSIDIDTPVAVKASSDRTEQTATGEGTLSGTVLSSEGNVPVAGARVFVRGTSVDVRTDESGHFSAKVPSGKTLSISVVHSAYSAQTIGGITVKKDGATSKTIKLTPASMELEEFVVLAPKIKGSLSEVMMEEKKSSAVTNILGSEEMSKKGDSDAASALKRVTGVTLVGGKSIYVRGLGDRYSNIELNSMPLPSPDPTKRVVPLDIFPSGVISSMKVQKSGTADVPANFGGGYVDIRTKESSDEDYVKISLGIKGNSNTGKNTIDYEGSKTDWTGFDDGYRNLDPSILNATRIEAGSSLVSFSTDYFTKEELSAFTQKFINRLYNFKEEKLPIGGSASVEYSKNFDLDDENRLSVFANYEYSQESTYREEDFAKYTYDIINDKLYDIPSTEGMKEVKNTEYSQAGIFNLAYRFSDAASLSYTKLYTHTGFDTARYATGAYGSNPDDYLYIYDAEWEERTLNTDQINGKINYEVFNHKNEFNFGLEHAVATLEQPNNYRYMYMDTDGIDTGNDPYLKRTSNQYARQLSSNDDQKAFYVKNKFYLNYFSEEDFIEIGYADNWKNRKSALNTYQLYIRDEAFARNNLTIPIDDIYALYLLPDIPWDDRQLQLQNNTSPSNYFDALLEESSFYQNIFLKPWDNVDVLFGVREVNVDQITTSYYRYTSREYYGGAYNPDLYNTIQKIDRLLELENEFFPSMSLKYSFGKNDSIDVAYSETFIMPDLREASTGTYNHPYEIADVRGNPDLVPTFIYSYDLKYSHYFSETENVKIGLFYKTLDNPIEDTMYPTSSLPIYTFMNSDTAEMYGIEIDGRKRLDFISEIFKDFYLSGNFTYTDSDVTIPKDQEGFLTTNHRQLQGLSQFVTNVALSYETPQRSLTLAYNKMGERIRRLGIIDGSEIYPDTMENPAAVLDFIWIENLDGGYSLKMKIGNILDGETIWYQQDEEHYVNRFKTGRTFSFSATYKY